ncbi:MAG TPA: Hsp20/alpha crystallin family protein [Gemmatimonadaceae bacterium]
MAIIRAPRVRTPSIYTPFTTMNELENRIRRFFDDPLTFEPLTTPIGFVPATEIVETSEAFMITVELPGLTAKDVDVSWENEMVTIRGEKTEEKVNKEEEKDWKYYMVERSYGSFNRTFTLPRGVDPDHAEANFTNGVLTLKLPKLPAMKAVGKKIAIGEKK